MARESTNGYKLDKSHIFAVNMLDDFDKYLKVPDEWTPAELRPYVPGVDFSSIATIFYCYYFLHSFLDY